MFEVLIFGLFFSLLSLNSVYAEEPTLSELASVSRVNAPIIQQYIGRVEAVNKATMKAQTSGRLAQIYFDVDDIVQQGGIIARLNNGPQKADLDLAKAGLEETMAEYERNQADYDRYNKLYQQKLVAVTVLDQSRAALKASKARLDSAHARIKRAKENYEYTIIRAPYSGIVKQRHVEVGESVNPGSPIVSGISLNEIRVAVDIPQKIVSLVRARKQAKIFLVDGTEIDSSALTIFPFANDVSHTFTVRVDIPLSENTSTEAALYPGMLVSTGFVIGEQSLLVIPEAALTHRGEINAVYVKTDNNQITMRQVRPGRRFEGNRLVILAGLSEGEKVFLDPLSATAALKHQVPYTKQESAHE